MPGVWDMVQTWWTVRAGRSLRHDSVDLFHFTGWWWAGEAQELTCLTSTWLVREIRIQIFSLSVLLPLHWSCPLGRGREDAHFAGEEIRTQDSRAAHTDFICEKLTTRTKFSQVRSLLIMLHRLRGLSSLVLKKFPFSSFFDFYLPFSAFSHVNIVWMGAASFWSALYLHLSLPERGW